MRMSEDRLILLPGDLEFEQTLATPPPDWRRFAEQTSGTYAFVADSDSGLLRTVDGLGCREYLLGGEYEQRLSAMYDFEDDLLDDLEEVDELYIDW